MLLYILLAILLFGVLIALHELGHFITAKWMGVRVNEFSIGMGPVLYSTTRGETSYSLRWFPIGGYCAMEGEDESAKEPWDDPKSFANKSAWRKLIILAAGSFMNFMTGLVILLMLFAGREQFMVETVVEFRDDSPLATSELLVGDHFLEVDGHAIYSFGNANYFLGQAGDVVDLVIERDGEKIVLDDFDMTRYPVISEGESVMLRGLTFGADALPATPLLRVEMAFNQALDYMRMVWISLSDLISGAVNVGDLSGPLGIVNIMGQAGEAGAEAAEQAGKSTVLGAITNILAFTSFISVNLAVMNLLPIPALDGGRILFLAVNGVFTAITKRKLDPKYEGYVNMVGFFALILLMAIVTFNDVMRLVG